MLSVPVQENVLEVEPKIIANMTFRQLGSLAAAIALAVGVAAWTWFVLGIPISDLSVLVYVIVIPVFLFGFVKPYGMKFEQFFPRFVDFAFNRQLLAYRSSVAHIDDADTTEEVKAESNALRRAASRADEMWIWPGCELVSPTSIVERSTSNGV